MSVLVHFETHATTVDNEIGVATGWLPGTLSEAGRYQAEFLGTRLHGREPDAVITSDLKRARDTVGLGRCDGDLPVFYDGRLRECHYGDLTGADRNDVLGPIERYLYEPYPGGESWSEALDRVEAAIIDIARYWNGGTVVVVGHVSTRWALDRFVLGRTLEDLAREDFAWQPGWTYIVNG